MQAGLNFLDLAFRVRFGTMRLHRLLFHLLLLLFSFFLFSSFSSSSSSQQDFSNRRHLGFLFLLLFFPCPFPTEMERFEIGRAFSGVSYLLGYIAPMWTGLHTHHLYWYLWKIEHFFPLSILFFPERTIVLKRSSQIRNVRRKELSDARMLLRTACIYILPLVVVRTGTSKCF